MWAKWKVSWKLVINNKIAILFHWPFNSKYCSVYPINYATYFPPNEKAQKHWKWNIEINFSIMGRWLNDNSSWWSRGTRNKWGVVQQCTDGLISLYVGQSTHHWPMMATHIYIDFFFFEWGDIILFHFFVGGGGVIFNKKYTNESFKQKNTKQQQKLYALKRNLYTQFFFLKFSRKYISPTLFSFQNTF